MSGFFLRLSENASLNSGRILLICLETLCELLKRPLQTLDRGLFRGTFLISHLGIDLDKTRIRLQHGSQGCLEQNDIPLRCQTIEKRL